MKPMHSDDGAGRVLNPYRFAWQLARARLRWDLNRESWRSRARLRKLRDSHKGKRAVIVCNGPSLLRSNLVCLSSVYTFGLNKINLLFDRSDFRPSSIVAVNPHVIEQNAVYYNETNLPLFLDSCALVHVRPRSNVTFLHSSLESRVVADVSWSLNQGYTVTCVAMQLALHMGFQSVALIGCDHNFASKGPPNAEQKAVGPDQSHFDPRYFSGGQRWNLPDLVASEYFYSMALSLYQSMGRELVNCTEGGKLDLLPRCSLEEFVAKGGGRS